MKVLVTGASGFIGSHLCQVLIEAGHKVRGLLRPSTPAHGMDALGVEVVRGDLTQPESLVAAMADVEVVFHLAAWTSSQDQAGRQYLVTVEGTRAILAAAQRNGVRRMVHVSASAALGVPKGNQAVDESHTWNYPPEGYPFGYAKYLAEMEVQKAVAEGLDVVIVNPTQVYGAGDRYRRSSSLVAQAAQRKLSMTAFGGSNIVHVNDVAQGMLAALEGGRRGERYLLGGENCTHADVLRMIAIAAGYPLDNVILLPGKLLRGLSQPAQWLKPYLNLPIEPQLMGLAGNFFYYSTEKAHRELGWQPRLTALQAIQDSYRWFSTTDLAHPAV